MKLYVITKAEGEEHAVLGYTRDFNDAVSTTRTLAQSPYNIREIPGKRVYMYPGKETGMFYMIYVLDLHELTSPVFSR